MYKVSLNGNDWKISGWWTDQWRFGKTMELGSKMNPAIPTVPASVPGSVQTDLIKAGLLDDPYYALDSLKGEWVNNRDWFYDKTFYAPDMPGRYELIFEGLDYHGEIYLNGEKIREFSGMFIPVTVDITGSVRRDDDNFIRIIFFKTPEVYGQFGYSSRIRTLKSRFNYVWDWCPRIIPVGIWDDVYLQVVDNVTIRDFYPKASIKSESINESQICGNILFNITVKADKTGEYTFEYVLKSGNDVIFTGSFKDKLYPTEQNIIRSFDVDNISLWWPNKYGDQPLYKIEVSVLYAGVLCDKATKRIGFRNIQYIQNQNSPENALPYTLMVNDERIPMHGVNWVPIRPWYGSVTRDEYRDYLRRFRDMNCTLLRIWGGAILEKSDFYDLCDEMGLMVWQEFPQSSSGLDNTPPDDPEFLTELDKVATFFLKKRRHHVSHVIWCGGNELLWENLVPVNDNHINIQMLKKLAEKYDPDKLFLPTSASGPKFVTQTEDFGKGICHDVHGPWAYMGDPDHYEFFNADDSLLRSEAGTPGASRFYILNKYLGNSRLWPPDHSNTYWTHRGSWWIQLEGLTELFGTWKEDELYLYIQASRYMQSESLRYASEATLRRAPVSSGFIIWMGNEPYPNNANTSVLECDGTPKPAYYTMRNTFARKHVSMKYNSIAQKSGTKFNAEIYTHGVNDTCKLSYFIYDIYGNIIREKNTDIKNDDTKLEIEWDVTPLKGDIFIVRLLIEHPTDDIICENTYVFTIDTEKPFEPLRRLQKAKCVITEDTGVKTIGNISDVAAVGVFLYGKNSEDFLDIYPNNLILMPNESKKLTLSASKVALDEIIIEGFNIISM